MNFGDFGIECIGGYLFGGNACGLPANQLLAFLSSDTVVLVAGVVIGVPLAAWLLGRFMVAVGVGG